MSDTKGRVSDWSNEFTTLFCEYEEEGEIKVRPVRDEIEACKMWWQDDRSVGTYETETCEVLTSFVGVRWMRTEPPLVYETLARDLNSERKWRYSSRVEAKANHDRIVGLLEAGTPLGEIK